MTGTVPHFGQHRARDIKQRQQVIIPAAINDIIHHGAGGVGGISDMGLAAGQPPDQVGIHRAEEQITRLSLRPCAIGIIQNPAQFRCREIGVEQQACLCCHHRLMPCLPQFLAGFCGAAILPDNGPANRAAGMTIPDHRRFTLVGDADGGNVTWPDMLPFHGLQAHGDGG